jgi:hypothetical protein
VVLVPKSIGTNPVLLVMVRAAEANAEDVMRSLTRAGIGGRAKMRKVDRASVAAWDTAAMRADPAPMPGPDLLQWCAHR